MLAVRLVLDTNVWLDWLVFDDPSVAGMRAACEAELARVLAYERRGWPLDAAAQAASIRDRNSAALQFALCVGRGRRSKPARFFA